LSCKPGSAAQSEDQQTREAATTRWRHKSANRSTNPDAAVIDGMSGGDESNLSTDRRIAVPMNDRDERESFKPTVARPSCSRGQHPAGSVFARAKERASCKPNEKQARIPQPCGTRSPASAKKRSSSQSIDRRARRFLLDTMMVRLLKRSARIPPNRRTRRRRCGTRSSLTPVCRHRRFHDHCRSTAPTVRPAVFSPGGFKPGGFSPDARFATFCSCGGGIQPTGLSAPCDHARSEIASKSRVVEQVVVERTKKLRREKPDETAG